MLKFKQCFHKDIWNLFQCLIIVLGSLKCNFKAFQRNVFVFSDADKNEEQMRQQTLVDQLFGLIRFNFLQIVPKMDY
jgi:hypothetical protein